MKIVTKTIHEVNHYDLDEAVSAEFGIKYESVPYEEWGRDESHSFNVKPEPLDDYHQGQLNSGKYHYLLGVLLNEMCHRGRIAAGEYLITGL